MEFIVLPTFAYEHKVFVGPFSRRFPNAKVGVLLCVGLVGAAVWAWLLEQQCGALLTPLAPGHSAA